MKNRWETFRKHLKTPNAITALVFTFSGIFSYLFAVHTSPFFNGNPNAELDLSRAHWEYCNLPNASSKECTFSEIKVPSDLSKDQMNSFHDWGLYRVKFTAPESCLNKQSSCSFFFEEIGDAAEVSVNDHVIGRHGQFPPNAIYAKHYPAQLQVSRDTLRTGENSNELKVLIYSSKRVQVGLRQSPVGLYTVENAVNLARRYTILNVINPLLAFVGLFMIAVFALFASTWFGFNQDKKLASFIRYAFVSSSFLISISEVPREYLPIWLAGYLHFVLRIASDWTYFEMVGRFFDYGENTLKKIRPLYFFCILAFVIECLSFFYLSLGGSGDASRGFDIGFTTLKTALPMIVLPHVMGLYASYKMRDRKSGKAFLALFTFTLIFQLHDSAIFHGLIPGVYLVKWYPFIIGVFFGIQLLEHAGEARSKIMVERERIKQMQMIHEATVGIAHDLEEPLKGLEMACKELKRNPDNRNLVQVMIDIFPVKVQRIYDLNKAILSYSKELSKPVEVVKEQFNIGQFIKSVVDEFRPQPLFSKVDFQIVNPTPNLLVKTDPKQLRRVLRNLIRNAGEAVQSVANPKVKIETHIDIWSSPNPRVTILVADNGSGVAPQIKERLFRPFESFGKENGTGLGLAMSKRLMEAQGSALELVETESGATFRVTI